MAEWRPRYRLLFSGQSKQTPMLLLPLVCSSAPQSLRPFVCIARLATHTSEADSSSSSPIRSKYCRSSCIGLVYFPFPSVLFFSCVFSLDFSEALCFSSSAIAAAAAATTTMALCAHVQPPTAELLGPFFAAGDRLGSGVRRRESEGSITFFVSLLNRSPTPTCQPSIVTGCCCRCRQAHVTALAAAVEVSRVPWQVSSSHHIHIWPVGWLICMPVACPPRSGMIVHSH